MKKILLVLVVLCFGAHSVKAQIENIKVDSTVTINSAYAGLLTGSDFSQNSLNFSKTSNVRVGVKATYSPTKWLSFVTIDVYQINEQAGVKTINQFLTKIDLGKICFETGFVPALASETKPMPATSDSQFESWTEMNIPGAALGAKVKYNFDKKTYVGIGIAQRNNEPEYHLKYSSSPLKLSLYYSEFNRKFGSSVAIRAKRIYNSTVYNADQNFSNYTSFKLNPKNDIDFYFDAKYDLKLKEIANIETGFLKNFSGKYLKGFFGLCYCHEIKVVRGYLFVHI